MLAVGLSIAYVDRPVADYVQSHLRHTALFRWTNRGLAPLPLVLVSAVLFLLTSGGFRLAGRALPTWTCTPLLCSWSAAWALSATTVLKHVFGRISPDPYYVVQRIYELNLLHADPAHLAFPSGTISISGAILIVLWLRHSRLRITITLILAVLGLALVITNSHWAADVIAGLFLGACIGRMTVPLLE